MSYRCSWTARRVTSSSCGRNWMTCSSVWTTPASPACRLMRQTATLQVRSPGHCCFCPALIIPVQNLQVYYKSLEMKQLRGITVNKAIEKHNIEWNCSRILRNKGCRVSIWWIWIILSWCLWLNQSLFIPLMSSRFSSPSYLCNFYSFLSVSNWVDEPLLPGLCCSCCVCFYVFFASEFLWTLFCWRWERLFGWGKHFWKKPDRTRRRSKNVHSLKRLNYNTKRDSAY